MNLSKIGDAALISHLELDGCVSILPRSLRPEEIAFQTISSILPSSKIGRYKAFFCSKAIGLNRKTSKLRLKKIIFNREGL